MPRICISGPCVVPQLIMIVVVLVIFGILYLCVHICEKGCEYIDDYGAGDYGSLNYKEF